MSAKTRGKYDNFGAVRSIRSIINVPTNSKMIMYSREKIIIKVFKHHYTLAKSEIEESISSIGDYYDLNEQNKKILNSKHQIIKA